MSSAYQLKPWNQVAIPHKDIRDGKLDTSVYAANLGVVARQDPNCPLVYRDAYEFFKATYLTQELKTLLTSVLKGLNGELGDRVLQLRTPFGGGKTHALVSLYHIAKNRDQLKAIPELSDLPDPGQVHTAEFIGLDMDVSTGFQVPNGPRVMTPWGYMAWQLGGAEAYALVAEQDQQRIAPGNDVLRQILGDRCNLILIDEFLVYVENAMALTLGDSTFGRQVLTFIQKLTEAVGGSTHTVMVYSLQASVQEAVGNEGLLGALDKLVSRLDAKKEPVSGDEVMKVVQCRLFESVGDPEVIAEVAKQQATLFQKYRESYADTTRGQQESQQAANLLAERIQISYPFHPDLLDLMYHRWGSLPSYQRTRGALQFLARVVYALKDNQTSWLISPGDIPFDDEGVRGAFFSQVGEREQYSSVFAADLTGRKAKVKVIDKQIAQDSPALGHLNVATRLASSIMLYSFGARTGEDRGVVEQELTAACLTPGLDRNLITATLSDLRENLLYLHYAGKRYRFETKPNLNKLIADEAGKISSEEVLDKVRSELSKLLGSSQGKVCLWPQDSLAIADRVPQFTVVYLGPDWAEKSRETSMEMAINWLEYRGSDKREYKNALCFVVPNKAQMDKSRQGARTALAISALLDQRKKYRFSPEDIEELSSRGKEAGQEIQSAVRKLYEDILLPAPDQPIRLDLIDLRSQLHTSHNLQERVLDALKNNVFDTLTVSKLVRLSGIADSETGYITGDDLVSYFFRFPTFPKMLSADAIKRAILEAIEQGELGYVPYMVILSTGSPQVENPALISYQKSIPPNELDLAGYLIAPSWIREFQKTLQPKKGQSGESGNSTEAPEREESNVQQSDDFYGLDSESSSASTSGSSSRAGDDTQTITYKSMNSSIERHIRTDVVDGKRKAKSYRLHVTTDKTKFFQLFEVLQNLSDKSHEMTIQMEVRAHTTDEFLPEWIQQAIEEPLDEMDMRASSHLE